jgi:26S proteasome regulatory subunit N10
LENTENENTEKLDAFIQSVTSDNNSKMVVIPPGPHNFVDMIVTTIMTDEQGNAPPVPGAFGADGIDPGLDPELAEAIRMSLEAERERQQKMEVDQEGGKPVASPSQAAPAGETSVPAQPAAPAPAEGAEEMDEETAMALAMSMEQFDADGDAVMKDAPAATSTAPAESKADEVNKALQDPNFVDDLLNDLNIPKDQVDIDDILNSLNEDPSKKKDQPPKDDKSKQ